MGVHAAYIYLQCCIFRQQVQLKCCQWLTTVGTPEKREARPNANPDGPSIPRNLYEPKEFSASILNGYPEFSISGRKSNHKSDRKSDARSAHEKYARKVITKAWLFPWVRSSSTERCPTLPAPSRTPSPPPLRPRTTCAQACVSLRPRCACGSFLAASRNPSASAGASCGRLAPSPACWLTHPRPEPLRRQHPPVRRWQHEPGRRFPRAGHLPGSPPRR